jgi:hypothetical protein
MKTTSLLIILLSVIGCTAEPPKRDAAFQTWRDPGSTLRQRADAVLILIPKGTELSRVKKVLGAQGHWSHRHGPRVFVEKSGNTVTANPSPDLDEWTFDYEVPSGVIKLQFTILTGKPSDRCKFIGVTFAEKLRPVPPIAR